MDGKVGEIFARGDELRKMGLNVPQVRMLVDELIRRGVPLDPNIYTVEKAKAALRLLLKEKLSAGEAD